MGRPRKTLTVDQVAELERLAGLGFTQAQIGDALGISDSTLRARLKEDLALYTAYKKARMRWLAEVAEFLKRAATGQLASNKSRNYQPNITAAIFTMKTQLGWRETDRLEHTGPGGSKLVIEHVPARPGEGATNG